MTAPVFEPLISSILLNDCQVNGILLYYLQKRKFFLNSYGEAVSLGTVPVKSIEEYEKAACSV